MCNLFCVFAKMELVGQSSLPPCSYATAPFLSAPPFLSEWSQEGGGNFPVWAKISNSEIFCYKKKKRVIFILSCWIQGKATFQGGGNNYKF